MSAADVSAGSTRRPFTGRRVRFGDVVLQLVAGAAALGATVLVGLIIWKLVDGSRLSLSKYGLGFVTRIAWNPVVGHELYGAGSFVFGTVITSFFALLIATPLAIGIALFLTELAPRAVQAPVTALVETLAAVPERPHRAVGHPRARPCASHAHRAVAPFGASAGSRSSGRPQPPARASSRRSSSSRS